MFLSKFVYFLPLNLFTKSMANQYYKLCSSFIWNKFPQIGRKILFLPKQFGGFGLIDILQISRTLKLNFYYKLLNSTSLNFNLKGLLANFFYDSFIKNQNELLLAAKYVGKSQIEIKSINYGNFIQGKAKYENYQMLPTQLLKVFKTLRLSPNIISFFLKLFWDRLPTTQHLKSRRGMINLDDRCTECNDQYAETWTHLLIDCKNTKSFLNQIEKHTKIKINNYEKVFNVNSWTTKNAKTMHFYLIIAYVIWRSRNTRKFYSIEGYQTPMSLLKIYLGTKYFNNQNVKKYWNSSILYKII